MIKFFSATILAIGIALAGFFVGHAIVQHQYFNRYITAKGLSERSVKANEAQWQINYSCANDNIDGLYTNIRAAQTAIEHFLKANGFTEQEISRTPVSITDTQGTGYSSGNNKKRYNASGKINLITTQVDAVQKATPKVSELIKQGVILGDTSVAYKYTQLNGIKQAMLIEATQNAQKAAQVFATSSHSTLGHIRNASQGAFSIVNLVGNTYDDACIMKKVRAVTTVSYFLTK